MIKEYNKLSYHESNGSFAPSISVQFSDDLMSQRTEVCEFNGANGNIFELTLDRQQAKMVIEVYRDGELIGDPTNFNYKPHTDHLIGKDWLHLPVESIIKRIIGKEAEFRANVSVD